LGAVGPGGPQLLTFPLHLLSRHAVLRHVVEWQSPSFSNVYNLLFLGLALSAVAIASRGGWEDTLPTVVFGAMALMALRNIPVASLVMCPVLARNLPISPSRPSRPSAVATVALAALLTLGAGMTALAFSRPAYDLQSYPVNELGWMRSHGLLEKRLAAPDDVGNYRTWTEGAHGEVFMDDRFDMYPPSVTEATITLTGGMPGWDRVLDRYRIAAVLWPRKSPLAEILARDPRWVMVHQTAKWVIATRAGGATL
jgi:hypothetical protein